MSRPCRAHWVLLLAAVAALACLQPAAGQRRQRWDYFELRDAYAAPAAAAAQPPAAELPAPAAAADGGSVGAPTAEEPTAPAAEAAQQLQPAEEALAPVEPRPMLPPPAAEAAAEAQAPLAKAEAVAAEQLPPAHEDAVMTPAPTVELALAPAPSAETAAAAVAAEPVPPTEEPAPLEPLFSVGSVANACGCTEDGLSGGSNTSGARSSAPAAVLLRQLPSAPQPFGGSGLRLYLRPLPLICMATQRCPPSWLQPPGAGSGYWRRAATGGPAMST
jgi:hypothetical protein